MRAEMQGAGSGPAADRRPVAPPGPCTTISRSMPSRTTSRPISSCALLVSGAELGHLAEHRPGAPAAADDRQRAQRGLHRVRVGVVGVVDQGDAAGQFGDLHPPAGRRPRPRSAPAATPSTDMPTARPTAAAVSALPTWCAPTTAQRHRRAALRGDQGEPGPVRVVLGDVLGPDQRAGGAADGDHLGGRSPLAIAATSGSSAFRMATPPSAADGSACTSSRFRLGDGLARSRTRRCARTRR